MILYLAMEWLEQYDWYQNFKGRSELEQFGPNSLLLYSLQLKYGIEDIVEEANNSLVDGNDDKKLDVLYYDSELQEIVVAQGYLATTDKQSAPSNKASDLNTGISWLLTRDLDDLPLAIRSAAGELRQRILDNEVKQISIWFSHNCPESTNCSDELKTAENTANSLISANFPDADIEVTSLEVGRSLLEDWYHGLTIPILVTESIEFSDTDGFEVKQGAWECFMSSIRGDVIHQLYDTHETNLFSANVRDYLGSRRTDSNINNGIKTTASEEPANFFVYNNGITALVNDFTYNRDDRRLTIDGFSIVNGAQTSGALGNLQQVPNSEVQISIRYIKCDNADIVEKIVKYNNSQNKINAPDFRSNDPVQRRLVQEFDEILGLSYSPRRGSASDIMSRNPNVLPSVVAGQVLAAFHNRPSISYNRKSRIFDNDSLYISFFNESTTAPHVYFAYTLYKAIESIKNEVTEIDDKTETQQELANYFKIRGSIPVFAFGVANVMEVILNRQIANRFQLHFCENLDLPAAIEVWKPIVQVLSSFVNTLGEVMGDGVKNVEALNERITQYRSLVNAIKGPNEKVFSTFRNSVCPKD